MRCGLWHMSYEEFYFVAWVIWSMSLNRLNLCIWMLSTMYMIYICVYIHTCHWGFTKVFSIKNVNLKPAYSTFNFQRYAINFVDYQSCPPFCSVQSQLCLILCDPMECSTPGCPVHHRLLEFIQTHVHWVSDAIQPSHPLSSPSLAFHLSQHQGLLQWVSSSHQVAKGLEFQL